MSIRDFFFPIAMTCAVIEVYLLIMATPAHAGRPITREHKILLYALFILVLLSGSLAALVGK